MFEKKKPFAHCTQQSIFSNKESFQLKKKRIKLLYKTSEGKMGPISGHAVTHILAQSDGDLSVTASAETRAGCLFIQDAIK